MTSHYAFDRASHGAANAAKSTAKDVGSVVIKRLALSACLSLFLAPAAHAANHGWYWGIEAGLDQPYALQYEEVFISRTFTEGMSTGAAVIATVGAHVGPQLRLEGELGWRWDRFDSGGWWNETTLMGNVLYDFPVGQDFTASIGGGVGADFVSTWHETEIGFAYQMIAGVAWSVSEQTAITLQYRYMSATGPTVDSGLGPLSRHVTSARQTTRHPTHLRQE